MPVVSTYAHLGVMWAGKPIGITAANARIDKAWKAFGPLAGGVAGADLLSSKIKGGFFVALVRSVLVYGLEAIVLPETAIQKL